MEPSDRSSGEPDAIKPSQRAHALYNHTAGWLIAALSATILAFLAATTFSQLRTDAIHDLATHMATVTAPAIEDLSRARGDLRRIETLLTLYTSDGSEAENEPFGSRISLLEVERQRLKFQRNIDAYLALPVIPGEEGVRARIADNAKIVDDQMERVVTMASSGNLAEARTILRRDLVPRAESLGLDLVHALDINGDSVRDGAIAIEHSRQSTVRIAFVVDALAVLLAIVVGLIAFQGIRRYMRLVAEQQNNLERHNEELQVFAMRVAHDIRGPLTPVAMAVDLGIKRTQDENTKKVFEAAGRSLKRVHGLVDGLLDFAKAGAVADPSSHVDAAEVLQGVVEDASRTAEAERIRLVLEVLPMPEWRCSAAVLSSIASNLVRNSMKFMGDARVREIKVRAREVDGKGLLEVIDTGPGIAHELTTRIFEPYVRAPGTSAPGVGLGLATVKRLAEAHGGRVGVDSRIGAGSRFWVELPVVR